uniref:Uncharacterized protein n=1 Tax=Xiphophorus couchianus TaxID=32473 RepID=A0A3B5LCY0_9TELE
MSTFFIFPPRPENICLNIYIDKTFRPDVGGRRRPKLFYAGTFCNNPTLDQTFVPYFTDIRGVQSDQIRGVGFDATCSLVVLDESFQPVPVTQEGERRVS